MANTKLVDLKEGPLHSTDDYIATLKRLINIPAVKTYLEKHVLVAPMDYPGQLNVRRAVNQCVNNGDSSGMPRQLQHVVPMIGPLHVSLNGRETVFLANYAFFDKLFHDIYGHKKVLAKKPKPYKINLLLELAFKGWYQVRLIILHKFEHSKDPEARYLINLLDNTIPLVLDFYAVIFRSGSWPAYQEAMFRIWAVFYQYRRKNYNKLPLAFLSDVFYWASTKHPISQVLSNSLQMFNDYYVENFHSSLRRRIQNSSTAKQIIQEARIIDQMRDTNRFRETFSQGHNIRYSAKQLEYLEKRTAIFLLNLFAGVCQNLGQAAIVPTSRSKFIHYKLPTLDAVVDSKILPMAWSTSRPPETGKYCDFEGCAEPSHIGVTLVCGHAYHFECFLTGLGSQCQFCTNYLIDGIEKNCRIFQESVSSFGRTISESENEWEIPEKCDDTSIGDEDFSLDNSIERLFQDALDVLDAITIA
jgi:hypothetical protein